VPCACGGGNGPVEGTSTVEQQVCIGRVESDCNAKVLDSLVVLAELVVGDTSARVGFAIEDFDFRALVDFRALGDFRGLVLREKSLGMRVWNFLV
jgi:hypothetical protein